MPSCVDIDDSNRRVGVFKKFIGHGVIFFLRLLAAFFILILALIGKRRKGKFFSDFYFILFIFLHCIDRSIVKLGEISYRKKRSTGKITVLFILFIYFTEYLVCLH